MAKNETDPLDFIEFEDDDTGEVYRRKATRFDLKARIRQMLDHDRKVQRDLSKAYRRQDETQRALSSLQRRVDNVEFGRQIGVVLGDGFIRAVDARVEIEQDFVDVSTRFGDTITRLPGATSGKATFEFAGDPEALQRLAKFLVTGEVD